MWNARRSHLFLVSTQQGCPCMRWKRTNLLLSFLGHTWTWSNTKPGSPMHDIGRLGWHSRHGYAEIRGSSDTARFSHLYDGLLWRPSTISTLSSERCATLARKCGPRCAGSCTFSVVSCQQFSCTVHVNDASEEAWGLVTSTWGTVRKETCFRCVNAMPARSHALVSDAVAAAPAENDSGAPPCWEQDDRFTEISPIRSHESLWTIRCSAPWQHLQLFLSWRHER